MIPARIRTCPLLLAALLLPLAAGPVRSAVTLLYSPTPADDIQAAWLARINHASVSIHIACYGISDKAIANALADAAMNRHVEVILDEDRQQSSQWYDLCEWLAARGCHVVIKTKTAYLHDKMGIFDGKSAILSSGNLSADGLKEDNSAAVFDDEPSLAGSLEANWETIFKRDFGRPYSPGMALPPLFAPDTWQHHAPP